jgi:hypothetical protein
MAFTSVIRYVKALDSTSTSGAGKSGLVFGDFTAKYLRKGGTLTSLTTETITTLGTYQAPTSSAHIRIKEVNSAAPTTGIYEVHFHNTQVDETAALTWLFLSATGAVIQPYEMQTSDYRLPDAPPFTAGGLAGHTLLNTVAGYVDTEVAAILAAVDTEVADIQSRLPAALTTDGLMKSDTLRIGGTLQTAKDLGAINVTNLNTLSGHDPGATLGTSTLTQSQVAGGAYALNSASFAFNAALDFTTTQKTSLGTAVGTAQTGDPYLYLTTNMGLLGANLTAADDAVMSRLGAPVGLSLSADIAAVKSDTASTLSAVDTEVATILTEVSAIQAAIGTPSNLGGGATLAANLADIEAQTDDIGAAGAGLTAIPWNASWDAEVQSEVDDALKAGLTESYRAHGATGSVAQMLYELLAHEGNSSNSGTTKTLKNLAGTPVKTYTYDDAADPTSISMAS